MDTEAFILPLMKLINSPRRFWGKFWSHIKFKEDRVGMTWHAWMRLLVVENTRSSVHPEAGRVGDFTC